MPQPRSNDPLRRAIRKLVVGLEKREQVRRERRRYNRQPLEVKIHLCIQMGAEQFQTICEAWAIDLSIGGISCLAEQSIDSESSLFVNFQEILGHACYIPIRVRRSHPLIGNIYQIHGQFVYESDSDPGEPGDQAQVA